MTEPDVTADAERIRAQAAALPSAQEIRDLAARALAHGGTSQMSLDEIRALASQAVAGAEQVNVLLRHLSELLAESGPPAGGGM